MKKTYLFGGLTVVLFGVVGYYVLGRKADVEVVPVAGVQRVVMVARGDLDLTVSANGVVQPINKVEVRSKASGQILELNAEEGSNVRKGDLLVALDQTTTKNDYEQSKADLASAQQQLSQAENAARRSQQLYEKKLISDQDLDQSKLDLVRAQSQLVRANAALSSADDRLRDTRILAPINGLILSRSVDLGQIIASAVSNVGGGTILATVADMDEVYVLTNVDEVDIGKVAIGQRAKVVADAFSEDSFNGEIVRIAPLGKTQQNVTTFSVVIVVKNIAGKLKAGMSASVDIEIFRRQNVVLVPNEALKDPRSEQGRALLASFKLDRDSVGGKGQNRKELMGEGGGKKGTKQEKELSLEEMRRVMENGSPAERDKMREQMRVRVEKMSPEERQKMFAQVQQRMSNPGQGGMPGGGIPPGGGGMMMFGGGPGGIGEQGGEGTLRRRRQSQLSDAKEVKERIVLVKQGDQFIPRLVKIGASNFDHAEVLEGLKEGDTIQFTMISRAKIAAEQMNERMRSMQGLGGMSGGGPPPGR
ncbi:MAG: HlyD protein [Bacteroidetes bacterium]|nr:HlyD protein [Bacteroidota bacterium]